MSKANTKRLVTHMPRWRHDVKTLVTSLDFCERNSPVICGFPSQGPVVWRFNVFFVVSQNKLLKKQSGCWWFEMPWRSCDVTVMQDILIVTMTKIGNVNLIIYIAHRCITLGKVILMPLSILSQLNLMKYVTHIDGLMQERHNSIANALKLRLSCTNPTICRIINILWGFRTMINVSHLRSHCNSLSTLATLGTLASILLYCALVTLHGVIDIHLRAIFRKCSTYHKAFR